MKKFFAAVCCCALVGLNVTAQEPTQIAGDVIQTEAAHSIIEAPDTDATLTSSLQDAPAATPVPDVVEAVVVEENAAPIVNDAVINEGVVYEGQAAPGVYLDQTFTAAPVAGYFAGPADCGCGQAAPVMNYAAPVTTYAAPAVDAGCGCSACAPAVDCCDAGRTRPQVVSRVRGRMTSVRGRVGSRRNNDCCDPCCN